MHAHLKRHERTQQTGKPNRKPELPNRTGQNRKAELPKQETEGGLLLKQWELGVQHPKEFALGPNSAVEHAGAVHFGPTRLGLV